MKPYHIVVAPAALRHLEAIAEPHRTRVRAAITALANQPRGRGTVKMTSQNLYRIRVGVYRVIYAIHDNIVTIVITEVGHRSQIYRNLPK